MQLSSSSPSTERRSSSGLLQDMGPPPRHGGNFAFASLSPSQSELEERLRTVCLCICASGVFAYGLARLKFALVPLVLSLSLKYLLQPMIDALSQTGPSRRRRRGLRLPRLPHSLAVVVALVVALAILATLATIVAESVRDFTSRADMYASQVQLMVVNAMQRLDATGFDERWRQPQTLEKVADKLDLSSVITAIVFSLGEGLLSLLSTTMLVLLFTMYLLLEPVAVAVEEQQQQPSTSNMVRSSSFMTFRTAFSKRVDKQINEYIKGKLLLSLLVGVLTAACLAATHVDLWLAFGVVSFFTNFVPNLGALVAVALPAPVCFFGPKSSTQNAFLALTGLVLIHTIVGNIIEPIVFGNSMKLHPVAVLLALMIWSYLWGVPGAVLAVPMTAVLKIYLTAIDHPLAEGLANALDGRFEVGSPPRKDYSTSPVTRRGDFNESEIRSTPARSDRNVGSDDDGDDERLPLGGGGGASSPDDAMMMMMNTARGGGPLSVV